MERAAGAVVTVHFLDKDLSGDFALLSPVMTSFAPAAGDFRSSARTTAGSEEGRRGPRAVPLQAP